MDGAIHSVALSDVGRYRANNEDAVGEIEAEDGARLFVVADGLGGAEAGEEASQAAVDGALEMWAFWAWGGEGVPDPQAPGRMKYALKAANKSVGECGRALDVTNLGTTIVALGVHQQSAWVGHVGDSRVYRLRKGEPLEQLTEDHSVAQTMVKLGILTRQDAQRHPDRHLLSRCLGGRSGDGRGDLMGPLSLVEGDTFLLCSDGLCGVVEEHWIEAALRYCTCDDAARRLIDLANHAGGPDNITVQVVRVGRDEPLEALPEGWRWPDDQRVSMAMLALVSLLIVLWVALNG